MEAAHSRARYDPGTAARAPFHGSPVGRVLLMRQVASVGAVVLHVLSKKAPEVILVEDDHPIQEFPPTTADPAFRDPILPGTAICGAPGPDLEARSIE